MDEMLDTKMKTKNTTLSEQFENPIEKSLETEAQSIPLTYIWTTAQLLASNRTIQYS